MKLLYLSGSLLSLLLFAELAQARGFGGARVGGFNAGGFNAGGFRAGGAASYGGFRAGGVGAYGGGFEAAGRGASYTTPRGTTIDAGRVGGVGVGPYGGVRAGGAEGVRVTTPAGRSYTDVNRGGIGVGPAGGVRVGGGSAAAVRGPAGGIGYASRGSVGIGPYGGVAAGGVRVGGIGGAGAAAVVGHHTGYINPTALRNQAAVIRTGGGFGYTAFTAGWYRGRVGIWAPARWVTPTFWAIPVWGTLAPWCGFDTAVAPISYDYGSNVVINEDNVYVNGDPYATAPQYAEQALQIADVGRTTEPAKEDTWQPLGVFGLVQGDEQVAQNIFQLAINKQGVVRGNYYDALADNNLKVYGSLDKKTQRVAWSVGEKKDVVFEAGLNNLTQPQTTILVHYGKERSRQMVLVRLQQPDEAAAPAGE